MNPNPAKPIFFIIVLQSCFDQPVYRLPNRTILIELETPVIFQIGKRYTFFKGAIQIIRYKYPFPADFYKINNKVEVVKPILNQG